MSPQLQAPSYWAPIIDCESISCLLTNLGVREGDPALNAQRLIDLGESLMDVGLVTWPKESTWAELTQVLDYIKVNSPSNFADDNEDGEEIIILSRRNREYLEDYCASTMMKKYLKLLTKHKHKREKLKTFFRNSYASDTAFGQSDDDFEPFRYECKDEARQWLAQIPEKSHFAPLNLTQPHVRPLLKQYLAS